MSTRQDIIDALVYALASRYGTLSYVKLEPKVPPHTGKTLELGPDDYQRTTGDSVRGGVAEQRQTLALDGPVGPTKASGD